MPGAAMAVFAVEGAILDLASLLSTATVASVVIDEGMYHLVEQSANDLNPEEVATTRQVFDVLIRIDGDDYLYRIYGSAFDVLSRSVVASSIRLIACSHNARCKIIHRTSSHAVH